MLNFSIAYQTFFAQLLVKEIWSGQVRSRSYDVTKGTNNLRQDFSEIVSKRNLAWCDLTWLTWMGIVDVIGVNTWLAVTLDLASHEFQGHLRSPEVTDLGWPHNDQWPIGICLVGFPEVLNPNMWFIVDKNVSKPLLPQPLGQSSSLDQF